MTMTRQNIISQEFRITQLDSNWVGTDGTASVSSRVGVYTVPNATAIRIRSGDVLAMQLFSSTPTELTGSTSSFSLRITDANGLSMREIANGNYNLVNQTFTDRNNLWAFSSSYYVMANQKLELHVNGNLAVSESDTVFMMSCLQGTDGVLF
jgi:hypothetical protein